MSQAACTQPGCPVATSGRCLEGFVPAETCPYRADVVAQANETERDIDDVGSYNEQAQVDLPSGDALTSKQADEVARETKTKLIVIAGPIGSGKTTILSALFEAFQDAPFATFLFRGSRTLVGFEKRSHLGREEAGSTTAETPHTSLREGVLFLHLELATIIEEEVQATSLLLSDVSGELFRQIRDSSEVAKDFHALVRADAFVIVLDGAKIVSKRDRQLARNDSRSILRSILESQMLSSDCCVDVVFTKWDIVTEGLNGPDGAHLQEFLAETRKALSAISTGREIRFHEIAARPKLDAKTPFAHGLPTLLRAWLSDRQISATTRLKLVAPSSREFIRYAETMEVSNKPGGGQ